MGGVDGDAASLLFRSAIDLVEVDTSGTEDLGAHASQSGSQSGLAMVDVTNGADVDVRFVTFELFFSHRDRLPSLN